ncbi:MAG: leucine-rich repeat domain-containing protein, partial [Candidatus Marinimicrobia bacterium]|nr:leucine-rich repeat domain-containing protein [Candidatus Neomarinimicrobiota bacterium]
LINLDLMYNHLTGFIPPELGSLVNLRWLALHYNQLNGSIPSELGNLGNLTQLVLGPNQLTGTIPAELGNLGNLEDLVLSRNQLTGFIPAELGNLTKLTTLDLRSNQLTGSIPALLGNLVKVTALLLGSNQLAGSIPSELKSMVELVDLRLNSNQLTGSIPSELGNLTNLRFLYLNYNQLTGSIPAELGNLVNLQTLVLNYNQLTGSIPAEMGNLANLVNLYLNSNQLTGLPDLNTLTALNILQVENNRLTFEDLEPNMGVASQYFNYAPQGKVGSEIDISAETGQQLVLAVEVYGSANQYQWIKNGEDLSGATDDTLFIESVTSDDRGSYALRITNTIVTGLTLYSQALRVTVDGELAIYDTQLLPETFAVHQNYPNPFNPSTTIRFDLPEATEVSLVVYDILGHEINRLHHGWLSAGGYSIIWKGQDSAGRYVPSGIYIARLTAPSYTKSVKLVLLK